MMEMRSPGKVSGGCVGCARSPFKSPLKGTNELSPRRTPRSPMAPPATPPQWKRPDEVMRLHRVRARQSLAARLTSPEPARQRGLALALASRSSPKRKNPFRASQSTPEEKRTRQEAREPASPGSPSLYRLLGLTDPYQSHWDLSVDSILDKIRTQSEPQAPAAPSSGSRSLPLDWTLHAKVRFMSPKPFPWNKTLRSCEEASGLTGFVRCVDGGGGACAALDTSPSALFHQSCLLWQAPCLPWLSLFPRTGRGRGSAELRQAKSQGSLLTAHQQVRDALFREWAESFRSLCQLVRVRHCPYFYLAANSVTVLVRAAGINGQPEISAMLTPTTAALRTQLKEYGVEFSMPLRRRRVSGGGGGAEAGAQDAGPDGDEEEEEDGDPDEWLASMGVDKEDMTNISISQGTSGGGWEERVDGSEESLLLVEGVEAAKLFNFLVNWRSAVGVSGALAGVPPTLLAPVAFAGASLASLQARDSEVHVDHGTYQSLELRGPILPHTVQGLADLLAQSADKFSVTFAPVEPSQAFTRAVTALASSTAQPQPSQDQLFSLESLGDCGLKPSLLPSFCQAHLATLDSFKFANKLFSWNSHAASK